MDILRSIWDWVCNAWNDSSEWLGDMFSSGTEMVSRAASSVIERFCRSPESRQQLERMGLLVQGSGAAAMGNTATRDAAIYGIIQTFYQDQDNPVRMMQRLTHNGLNNGTTTRAVILNSGEGSAGRGDSRHQAVLVTNEASNPPQLVLAFRGANGLSEGPGIGMSALGVWFGTASADYAQDAETFWRSAGPEIQRAYRELQARHPNTPVQITVAGHSYGADGAARMIPHLTELASPDRVRYVGYGGIQTMTIDERNALWERLGGEQAGRATQYMVNNDWASSIGWGYMLGTRRNLPTNTGHLDYASTGGATVLMAAVEDQIQRSPDRAREVADRIIADFERDSAGTLRNLADYARNMAGSGTNTITGNTSPRGAAVAPA